MLFIHGFFCRFLSFIKNSVTRIRPDLDLGRTRFRNTCGFGFSHRNYIGFLGLSFLSWRLVRVRIHHTIWYVKIIAGGRRTKIQFERHAHALHLFPGWWFVFNLSDPLLGFKTYLRNTPRVYIIFVNLGRNSCDDVIMEISTSGQDA